MSSLCLGRLQEERKVWRKDHPPGFFAKPKLNPDGSANLMMWDCGIPGKEGTIWEGGVYPLTIRFSEDYPTKPPICYFPPGFFHPNIYPNGVVCLSILSEEKGWKPSISLKQIVIGVQDLLDTPNERDPAQTEAYSLYIKDRKAYNRTVQRQSKKYAK